jgi:hypothetical protein
MRGQQAVDRRAHIPLPLTGLLEELEEARALQDIQNRSTKYRGIDKAPLTHPPPHTYTPAVLANHISQLAEYLMCCSEVTFPNTEVPPPCVLPLPRVGMAALIFSLEASVRMNGFFLSCLVGLLLNHSAIVEYARFL